MSAINCRCDVPGCGEIYLVTPSGGICPNGHGKVVPGVTQCLVNRVRKREKAAARTPARVAERQATREAAKAAALAQLRALPLCRYTYSQSGWWNVEGREERFRRVAGPYAATSRKMDDYLGPGEIRARTLDGRWCALKELA